MCPVMILPDSWVSIVYSGLNYFKCALISVTEVTCTMLGINVYSGHVWSLCDVIYCLNAIYKLEYFSLRYYIIFLHVSFNFRFSAKELKGI